MGTGKGRRSETTNLSQQWETWTPDERLLVEQKRGQERQVQRHGPWLVTTRETPEASQWLGPGTRNKGLNSNLYGKLEARLEVCGCVLSLARRTHRTLTCAWQRSQFTLELTLPWSDYSGERGPKKSMRDCTRAMCDDAVGNEHLEESKSRKSEVTPRWDVVMGQSTSSVESARPRREPTEMSCESSEVAEVCCPGRFVARCSLFDMLAEVGSTNLPDESSSVGLHWRSENQWL